MDQVAQSHPAAAAAVGTAQDARTRLGKLAGMLGSDAAGERANAVDAIGRELARAGLSFAWLAELVVHGQVADPQREKLLADLVAGRLKRGLIYGFGMSGSEQAFVQEISAQCGTGLSETPAAVLRKAVAIADEAQRRAKP